MNNHVITPEQWAEYQSLKSGRVRLLGYVREEMLEACRSAKQGVSLTVVPVAPKSGRWVPLYVEENK